MINSFAYIIFCDQFSAVISTGRCSRVLNLKYAGSVEVRCEYCGDVAQFSETDLQQVLQSSS